MVQLIGYSGGHPREASMDTSHTTGGNRNDPAALERLRRLQTLLRADPGNEPLARECMERALACGDYDFVLEQADQTLARSPEDLVARFNRATALMGKRDYESAIVVLREIAAGHSELTAAQINLGLCHYCLGQHAQARAPLESAYQAGDRSAQLLHLLVSTYHHLGLLKEAIAVAEANPQAASADAGAAGVYALAYLDAGLPQPAARWAARALKADPDCVDGLIVQATLEAARMHVAHARDSYERVLQLAPENARALIGLGTLALLARDLARARSLLERGVARMPRHVGSWHVLAWARLVSGDLAGAEQALEASAQIDRNFAETHGGLASIAALRGERDKAERGIETALRLDPRCLSAQFARSVLMSRAGDAAGGRQLIRETLSRLSPGDGSLLSRVIEEAANRQ
jgi:tetratricopeptide (TPR) repeat protein